MLTGTLLLSVAAASVWRTPQEILDALPEGSDRSPKFHFINANRTMMWVWVHRGNLAPTNFAGAYVRNESDFTERDGFVFRGKNTNMVIRHLNNSKIVVRNSLQEKDYTWVASTADEFFENYELSLSTFVNLSTKMNYGKIHTGLDLFCQWGIYEAYEAYCEFEFRRQPAPEGTPYYAKPCPERIDSDGRELSQDIQRLINYDVWSANKNDGGLDTNPDIDGVFAFGGDIETKITPEDLNRDFVENDLGIPGLAPN